MNKYFSKTVLLLIYCFPLFVNNLVVSDEGASMHSEFMDIEKRISRVENGLISAICIQGFPLERKNIVNQMNDMKIPAASIAVINDGKIEWAKAYGQLSSNIAKKADITSRFQAGSVSKPVAAFAILSLVDKKLVELDENVNCKLTSWKVPENEYTKLNKVTLRNLLSHCSGLGVIGFDGYREEEDIPTITETLDGVPPSNNPPVRVEFQPASKMSYSGGGYNVAQQLVEDITNEPFCVFMDRVLLKPLNMTESSFGFLNRETSINVAYAHPTNGIPMIGGWKTYPESAAAGLWTTPVDLAKWLIEIQNELNDLCNTSIISKNLLEDMVTPQVTVHGLGPVVNGQGAQLKLNHKGSTDGFTCGFVSFPYLNQGAVVMVNAGNQGAFIDDVLRSIALEYNWPSYSVKTKTTIELTEKALDKYVGRYGWNEKPNDIYDLFLFREKNELWWKIGNASNANRLYSEANNQFFLVDTGYDVVFKEVDAVITSLTIIVQPGFEREFRKF